MLLLFSFPIVNFRYDSCLIQFISADKEFYLSPEEDNKRKVFKPSSHSLVGKAQAYIFRKSRSISY